MQWHKRDSFTHSFWHQVFYTYFTIAAPDLIYCTVHDTKQDWSFKNMMQGSAGAWTIDVVQLAGTMCNAFTPSSLFCLKSSCFLFSQFPCPLVQLLFFSLCPFIVFQCFCCISFLHTLSLGFLHAALCRAPPSQGLVTLLLQVTGRGSEEKSC